MPTCPDANTWHWDNVSISPAVPFTIIQSDRQLVEWNDSNPRVNFDAPAPANAFVRFHTMRDTGQTEISFDGGNTWVEALEQLSAKQVIGGPCKDPCISNYWHPVPDGTTSMMVRNGEGGRHDWFAHDFRIWSETVPDL